MQLSPAINQVLQEINDPGLLERVSFTFQNASATAESLRSLDFRRFEEKTYERNSTELWAELEPIITQVLSQMQAFLGLLRELFPEGELDGDEDDISFDDLEFDIDDGGGKAGKPAEPTKEKQKKTASDEVFDLVSSYVPMLGQELDKQVERLKNPNVRAEQWTLLNELVEFRDRSIGALHSMVAAVCSVFRVVRAEDLFPDARDKLERLVAQRRALADLELDIDFYNRAINRAENDELPTMLEMLQGKVIEFISHPAYQFLRPQERNTVRETAALLGNLAAAPKFNAAYARQTVEGFAKFLESMRTISLQEVLVDHDKESAKEGRQFLERAIAYLRTDFDQAVFQVMHGVRRLSQLYGVDAEVDRSYQNLPDIENKLTTPQQLADLIDELRVLFGRFPM
jgi:hypothetical protein